MTALLLILTMTGLAPIAADQNHQGVGTYASPPILKRIIPMRGVRWAKVSTTTGFQGRIDHLAYEPSTHRLFVAALTNHSLEVIDLDKGERIKSVGNLPKPQGIAVVKTTGQAVVACGGDGTIHAFDTKTLDEKKSALAGENADNVRFDESAGKVYVGCGQESGTLAVFDARTLEKLGDVRMRLRSESFQFDPHTKLVFTNCPGPKKSDMDGQVFALDRVSGKVEWHITLEKTARNFPMAFDEANRRLFIATRKPAKLIVLSAVDGRIIDQAPCVRDSDDLFYDAKTSRILVIGGGFRHDDGSALPTDSAPDRPAPHAGDGAALDVFRVDVDGRLKKLASTPTAPHARTGLFVPDRRAVYVAVPPQGDRDSEIREYLIDP